MLIQLTNTILILPHKVNIYQSNLFIHPSFEEQFSIHKIQDKRQINNIFRILKRNKNSRSN